MPLARANADHVILSCIPCNGTGITLRSVGPITYRRCWCCYGRRGRTSTNIELEAFDALGQP